MGDDYMGGQESFPLRDSEVWAELSELLWAPDGRWSMQGEAVAQLVWADQTEVEMKCSELGSQQVIREGQIKSLTRTLDFILGTVGGF